MWIWWSFLFILFVVLSILFALKIHESFTNVNKLTLLQEDKKKIISCGCSELATWHPARIAHKMKCPIFRKLNPDLTVKEFLKDEGFPTNADQDWPHIF